MRLQDAEYIGKGEVCVLETNFGDKNNSRLEKKLETFDPTACLTNTTPRRDTLLRCVRASYWRRTPVAFTVLRGTTEMECRWRTGVVQLCRKVCELMPPYSDRECTAMCLPQKPEWPPYHRVAMSLGGANLIESWHCLRCLILGKTA